MMDKEIITKNSIEISKSLINTSPGIVDLDLEATKSIGDIGRIATAIKMYGQIDIKQFKATAIALKIKPTTAIYYMDEMCNLGWGEIIKDGKNITRIDEHIPPERHILSDLGSLWEEKDPSPIDIISIKSLSLLKQKPYSKVALSSEFDFGEDKFNTALHYGKSANYLNEFTSNQDDINVIYTPLLWSGKLEQIQSYLNKNSDGNFDNLAQLTTLLKNEPGSPIGNITTKSNQQLIDMGVHYGFFPKTQVVKSRFEEFGYLFAPRPKFQYDPYEDVFEKTNIIISCLRHGQYHADISKIRNPQLVLERMMENSLKPHSYANVQYLLLKSMGIVDIQLNSNNRYKLTWKNTHENNIAGEHAIKLLSSEPTHLPTGEEIDARNILTNGLYSYTSELRLMEKNKKIAASDEFERLAELLNGTKY